MQLSVCVNGDDTGARTGTLATTYLAGDPLACGERRGGSSQPVHAASRPEFSSYNRFPQQLLGSGAELNLTWSQPMISTHVDHNQM